MTLSGFLLTQGDIPMSGQGAHSFLEKNPPHTPEEKHQDVSTSPWTPNDTKGEGCGPLPLETLSQGDEGRGKAPPLETLSQGDGDKDKTGSEPGSA